MTSEPPRSLVNPTSLIGLLLAVAGASAMFFSWLVGLVHEERSAYAVFSLLPMLGAVVLGAVLIPWGVLRERRRRARGLPPSLSRVLSIDLTRLHHRGALVALCALSAGATFAVLTVTTTIRATAEFTESNTFCGEVCHSVMAPEYVAYQHTSHARVECVECHVGPGRGAALYAKLNGMRQLWALATGHVERPIPTPIRTQRPAREICEECHWSSRFIGTRQHTYTYFLADEESTPVRLRTLVNIGGAAPLGEEGSGIHYHMSIGHRVEYIARDRRRQEIVWVRSTDPDGTQTVFESTEDPLSEEEKQTLEIRSMDCLDCHNRPAHRFTEPTVAVNWLLEAGFVAAGLPYVKREAVRALDGGYETQEAGLAGIERHLRRFYQEEAPEVLEEQASELERSIESIQAVFLRSQFPEMKADWLAHPDNLGHLNYRGCFRCHNDEMESEDGDPLFRDCDSCHVIEFQTGQDAVISDDGTAERLVFVHPEDEEEMEEYTECTDCHTGGAELYE